MASESDLLAQLGGVVQPYRMHISQRYLDLTRQKLELTRLPREPRNQSRAKRKGPDVEHMEHLLDHWSDSYDWRCRERYYNDVLPQFRVEIGGTRLHFVHKRSKSPMAFPLLILHGWPESFLSFSKVIDPLTAGEDQHNVSVFHVVIPSLPGAGFSDPVPETANHVQANAEVFHSLMQGLGYVRYIVHGSGWGLHIGRALTLTHPESCVALHTVNTEIPPSSDTSGAGDPVYLPTMLSSPADDSCNAGQVFPGQDGAATYALCDSPSGMLACMLSEVSPQRSLQNVESLSVATPSSRRSSVALPSPVSLQSSAATPSAKLQQRDASRRSSSEDLVLSHPWTPTAIIDWTMIYWLTGPETTARWLNSSRNRVPDLWTSFSGVPLGISRFYGKDDHRIADNLNLLQREQACHWVVMLRERDGVVRCPAWERPEEIVRDLREFTNIVLLPADAST